MNITKKYPRKEGNINKRKKGKSNEWKYPKLLTQKLIDCL